MFEKDRAAGTRQESEARGEVPEEGPLFQVLVEWSQLIARLRAELDRGTEPTCERVRALAARWRELVGVLTGNEPCVELWLRASHQQAPGVAARHGLDPRLFVYLGKAMASLDGPA
ncbi:TipAS antibiotic-recognition domain-containing protein [Pyxidicoccus xibeiensis]|uniref:TipAS antibiotic-recognition domain-containing protein n=1 Tax=Pyxidicoccus xibeiensis TaxID=2906759 RepID=UPI0020A75825|nr:TipAS antibiotic-recognition domain-containing protein [Pyxidicoccus xibeiensis]MCP3139622.1 TipAS antibiotic-recognition domain-containing protein [Pyxidicoccus xibeiensis]